MQEQVQELQVSRQGSPSRAAYATPHFDGAEQAPVQTNVPSNKARVLLSQESFGSLNNRDAIGAVHQMTSGYSGAPEPAFASATSMQSGYSGGAPWQQAAMVNSPTMTMTKSAGQN